MIAQLTIILMVNPSLFPDQCCYPRAKLLQPPLIVLTCILAHLVPLLPPIVVLTCILAHLVPLLPWIVVPIPFLSPPVLHVWRAEPMHYLCSRCKGCLIFMGVQGQLYVFPLPSSIVVGYFEKRPVCSYGFSFPLLGYYSLVGESQFSPTKGVPRVDVVSTRLV